MRDNVGAPEDQAGARKAPIFHARRKRSRRCTSAAFLSLPDFIANAGGVICAAIEYRAAPQKAAFEYIDERIRANTRTVLEGALRKNTLPRTAALALAERRVHEAAATRRWR